MASCSYVPSRRVLADAAIPLHHPILTSLFEHLLSLVAHTCVRLLSCNTVLLSFAERLKNQSALICTGATACTNVVYPPLHRGSVNLDISLLKLCGASQKTLLITRQRNTDDIILPTWPKSLAEILTVFVRGRRGPQEQSCFDGSNNYQRASFVSRPDVSAICKASGQTHSHDLTISPM